MYFPCLILFLLWWIHRHSETIGSKWLCFLHNKVWKKITHFQSDSVKSLWWFAWFPFCNMEAQNNNSPQVQAWSQIRSEEIVFNQIARLESDGGKSGGMGKSPYYTPTVYLASAFLILHWSQPTYEGQCSAYLFYSPAFHLILAPSFSFGDLLFL